MTEPIVPNIFTAISAPPKQGKTQFALSFPDPIVIYSLDLRGAELLVSKFPGVDITIRKEIPALATKHICCLIALRT